MSPVVFPAGVRVQGNGKLQWVPTVASISVASLAEINAAGSLDVSGYFDAAGWQPGINQNKGNPPRRLASTVQFEQFGNVTFSLGDLQYMFTPQGATASTGQLAYEKLTPGSSGFFVVRDGLDANTAFAIGQFVAIWPVTLGQRLPSGDSSDEFAEYMVTQPVIVTGLRTERVAITT